MAKYFWIGGRGIFSLFSFTLFIPIIHFQSQINHSLID